MEYDDFPSESLKFNNRVELQRQQTMRVYGKEEIVEICRRLSHFAEHISAHIMQCYTVKEWVTEQEELLKQSPEEDDQYIDMINLGFSLLDEDKTDILTDHLNRQIIEYKAKFPHNDIDEISAVREPVKPEHAQNDRRALFVDTGSALDAVEEETQQNSLAVVINLVYPRIH